MFNIKQILEENNYTVKIVNKSFKINDNIIAKAVSKKLTKPMVQKMFSEITLKNKFVIIAPYGYTKEALDATNKIIDIWTIEDIKSKIKLHPHNNISYKLLKFKLNRFSKGVVIQPTGTGKMYQMAKLVEDYENILLLAPTSIILNKFKETFPFLIKNNNIQLSTYSSITKVDISKVDLVICDELHRIGAEKWGENFKRIISYNKLIAGFTATSNRLDKKDVLGPIFNGHIASNMSLFEAIARRILPEPIYVTALYSIEEDVSKLKKEILNSKLKDKEKYIDKLDVAAINWSTANNLTSILKKYITDQEKFIIFHQDISSLKSNKEKVDQWFDRSLVSKEVSSSSSTQKFNKSNLKEFEDSNIFSVLHTVDMFNEGYHLESLDGAIFLRNTKSSNIYYQQMGRPMTVNSKTRPIIFDFVNNISTASFKSFEKGSQEALTTLTKIYEGMGIKDIKPTTYDNIEIYDHTINFIKEIKLIRDSMKTISQRVEEYIVFNSKFKRLPRCFNRNKKKKDYELNEISLYKWAEKYKSKKFLFNQSQIERLENINPTFFQLVREGSALKNITYMKRLELYKEFKEKYGRFPKVLNYESKEEKDLSRFRRYIKEGKITLKEKEKEFAISIDPNFFKSLTDAKLDERIEEFEKWMSTNKKLPSKVTENKKEKSLYHWRSRLQSLLKEGKLSNEIKDRIIEIDPTFLMNRHELIRYEHVESYIKWCQENGRTPINKRDEYGTEEYKLSVWKGRTRTKIKYGQELFDKTTINRIKEIDENFFVF